jgi:hypothetical protein
LKPSDGGVSRMRFEASEKNENTSLLEAETVVSAASKCSDTADDTTYGLRGMPFFPT